MPINPSIALAVKPADIQIPNALAQAAQLAQLRNYDIQAQEAQSALEERNRLRALNPAAADYEAQLFRVNPQLGIAYRKERTASEASEAARQKSLAEAAGAKQKMLGQAMRDISSRPSDANITAHLEDVLDSPLYNAQEKAAVQKRSQMLLEMPFEERRSLLAQQGATTAELRPNTQQVNRLGQTDIVQVPFGGVPTTVGTYTDVPLPAAVEAQKARIAKAGASNINLPAQEKSFEQELGKGQADRILKSKVAAEDAAQILQTNQVGRDILKSGAITGAGANFFVGLNNALQQGGIDFGYADAAANSQAYAAAMAQNVGKLIKQYGAGTGLSDADRNYATKAAAGEISMDEKAIRKILDINDRAANFVIDRHNKDVQGIKTNVPLSVEKPMVEQPRQPAAAQIPGQRPVAAPAVAIPQAAIDALKAGRGTDAQFDEIFGPGAAKRARGGK